MVYCLFCIVSVNGQPFEILEFDPSYRAILFLFCFNRIFASLVSYGIRAYSWHHYHVHIDVQALQFSFLAGRAFFKGFRYHGQNETILISDGYITWRYWLRHVQEADCKSSKGGLNVPGPANDDSKTAQGGSSNERAEENGAHAKSRRLPCRVLVKGRGVEWFIYNRSPAYDAILQSMKNQEELDLSEAGLLTPVLAKKDTPNSTLKYRSSADSFQKEGAFPSVEQNEERKGGGDDNVADSDLRSTSIGSSAEQSTSTISAVPGLLDILPIRIECIKGAVVMGNQNTRSIVTAKFDSAAGQIDARKSGAVDQYKQTFDFDFSHPVIEFKHNKDYAETQMSEGAKSPFGSSRSFEKEAQFFGHENRTSRFGNIWTLFRDFVPYSRGSVDSLTHPRQTQGGPHKPMDESAGLYGQNRWLGLTRYLDDDDDLVEQERWKAIEYGAFSTIVDSPEISMSIYWDVPGLIPHPGSTRNTSPGFEMDINGDTPPDWAIELKVRGGTINYGPWADRQRANLQAVFFPTLYKDAVPTAQLRPGQSRISTVLKVVLEIEDQTTFRVPTREDSKDWKWKGRTGVSDAADAKEKKMKSHSKSSKSKKVGQSPETRPFGWLDIKVLPDSTISLAIDLVARPSGYRNLVDLDLKGVEISSSVNHGLLWRSQSQVISCNLSNPLGWNGLRQWRVDIRDNGLELFMLRDHMFLLTDLISDWTSGPLGEFHTFVPFEYSIGLHFADFKLFLNANDSNIINNPSDVDDNTFVVIRGQKLKGDLAIPSKRFRPARSQVTFEIEATDGAFELRTPQRNTQHTYLDSPGVATLRELRIDGSYNYFTTTSPSLTDILLLNVLGEAAQFKLYGFFIRYLMKIKDNYFGDDIHFRTLEEYQSQIHITEEQKAKDQASGQQSRLSNDLDVILGISAENSCALFPAQLYSSERTVRLEMPSIAADLRITNYYMDLAVTISPIAVSHTSPPEPDQPNSEICSSTQVFVNGLEIFGHRLFGLPPTEPTYVCNWDFDVGHVRGECSVAFFHCLTMALRCFTLTFDDAENALPPSNPPVVHDVTFLRARIQPVRVGLWVDQAAFLLSTEEVKIEYNDWANSHFSDRLFVLVPDLTLSILDAHGVSMDRGLQNSVANTHAYLKMTLEMNKFNRKLDCNADRHLQQNHLALHDSRTCRVPWLVLGQDQPSALETPSRPTKSRPPAMTFPSMPEPLSTPVDIKADESSYTPGPGSSTRALTRTGSFLSMASSRQGKGNGRGGGNRRLQRQERQVRRSPYRAHEAEDPLTVKNRVEQGALTSPGQRDSRISSSMKQNHFGRSGLPFTSPYKQPSFPLLSVQPDISNVPILPKHLLSDALVSDSNASNVPRPHISDQKTEQSSYMVHFGQGIQTLCNPRALLVMAQLLSRFQTTNAIALLDTLQLDVVTDVLSAEAKRTEGARILDARFFIPWVGARFTSTNNSKPDYVRPSERYDVILEKLAVIARSSLHFVEVMSSPDPKYSFHVILDRITCSAREFRSNNAEDQAIISLSIRDIVAWMWQGTSAAAELQFHTLKIESASRKVESISLLVQKTLILSETFAQRFRDIEKEGKSRVRLLVLLLTAEGKDLPDPPFLTRASYVLRSASYHLRTSDSWKMMSRLRYIYCCLPAHSRENVHARCIHEVATCPEDAGSRVIASFDHWRTWDLAHVRSSLLMQRVFGELLIPPTSDLQKPVPTKATLRAGAIQILVEPGRSQNEVAIEELTISVALHQSSVSQGVFSNLQPPAPTMSTMQVHYSKLDVHLHWALLDVVEEVIKIIQETQSSSRNTTSSPETASHFSPQESCLHIAVSSDVSIFTVDSKNLALNSVCQSLRISIIFLHVGAYSTSSLSSVLVDADVATSEIRHRSASLTLYKLQRPRVFGSKSDAVLRSAENPWIFVGSGKDVSLLILGNPLEVIEVIESVMEHEVAHINKWAQSMRFNGPLFQTPVATQNPPGRSQANVALSIESHLISLTLLPSVTYQVSGTGARISFRSALFIGSDSIVDIDTQQHSHVFKSSVDEAPNELSVLRMPPVNLRLSLDRKTSQKSVAFNALVESIVFNASAVHAILTTVSQPDMVSLGENIRVGVSSVQNQYDQMFGMTERRNETLSSDPILYSGYVTLLSLAVQASTSNALSVSQGARLQAKMGPIQLKMTNRNLANGTINFLPETEVQFKGIQLKVFRFDNDEVHACGDMAIEAVMRGTSKSNDQAELVRAYQIQSNSLQVNVYTDTASVVVAILASLQDTLKTVNMSHEVQTFRRLGSASLRRNTANSDSAPRNDNVGTVALFSSMYSLEMTNICVGWKVGNSIPVSPGREPEDLVLSFARIDLSTKKENAARLLIQDLQLQMVPQSESSTTRSRNSALLPEVLFNVAYVSTGQNRRLAFQAAGKSLDLRLTSHFILPASDLRRSIALSVQQVRAATEDWNALVTTGDGRRNALLGDKRLASLLVDADFAGAVVFVQGRSLTDAHSLALNVIRGVRLPQHGLQNTITTDSANNNSTTLRAPGIAFKVEYRNRGSDKQSLNAEIKIDASSNALYPTVVPLIMEISSSIKDVVGDTGGQEQANKPSLPQPKFLGEERLRGADPAAIFGSCKLNLGLRICKQEFSLSCQPIARVAASACFENIYITINTVHANEHGRFFTVSATFSKLHASVQHVYSRESTGNFEVDSIIVSLMNSKHVSSANGISAILSISPMKAQVNAKQSQDFLLFQEIWMPPEIRRSNSAAAPVPASESQAFIVQRYQQIAAAGAFPWNATVSIAKLDIELELGQSLGKSAFVITDLWISSKKTSDWEQTLCLGLKKTAVKSFGRMSGFVELKNFKVRTSIQWPIIEKAHNQTPLVQASLVFDDLQVKASFDYQAFLIADITNIEFLMYNVRDLQHFGRDRLVGVLDGDKVQVFCTTTSASQAVALYQAFQRLYQEKLLAYEASLRDIEKFLPRRSSINSLAIRAAVKRQEDTSAESETLPLRLQTNVVVTLKSVNIGAFPSTFFDSQILKLEAFDASARFAVVVEHEKIYSTLGMSLGQLRVALASLTRASVPKTSGEISMSDVVASAANSRGGTILKVPKLVASMETWQSLESTQIDYTFKSSFQGKVDVGWNYSRISYIRGMWNSHARSLAQRLGKPLPQSAVQITGGPRLEGEDESRRPGEGDQEKITAVVNVPQSKYQYTALQPPIIETPQLRDMGEATPPLEWIGLHRERLPNLTHQIVIVPLLEVAKEVDDAYSKILGSS